MKSKEKTKFEKKHARPNCGCQGNIKPHVSDLACYAKVSIKARGLVAFVLILRESYACLKSVRQFSAHILFKTG